MPREAQEPDIEALIAAAEGDEVTEVEEILRLGGSLGVRGLLKGT